MRWPSGALRNVCQEPETALRGMKTETGKPIVVPELEEMTRTHPSGTYGMSSYPVEVDNLLVAYGGKIRWKKLAEYLNSTFGLSKTAEAYRGRYQRLIRERGSGR